jgi:hypothetical protein
MLEGGDGAEEYPISIKSLFRVVLNRAHGITVIIFISCKFVEKVT